MRLILIPCISDDLLCKCFQLIGSQRYMFLTFLNRRTYDTEKPHDPEGANAFLPLITKFVIVNSNGLTLGSDRLLETLELNM